MCKLQNKFRAASSKKIKRLLQFAEVNNEDAKRPNRGGVAPEPTGGVWGHAPPEKFWIWGTKWCNFRPFVHIFYLTLKYEFCSIFAKPTLFFCLGQKVNKLAYKYSEKSILPFKMMKLHTGMWKEGSTFSFE